MSEETKNRDPQVEWMNTVGGWMCTVGGLTVNQVRDCAMRAHPDIDGKAKELSFAISKLAAGHKRADVLIAAIYTLQIALLPSPEMGSIEELLLAQLEGQKAKVQGK